MVEKEELTSGNAAVYGFFVCHFQRQSHRSSDVVVIVHRTREVLSCSTLISGCDLLIYLEYIPEVETKCDVTELALNKWSCNKLLFREFLSH